MEDAGGQPLYQAWPAKTRPILGGRCLMGPNPCVLTFVVFSVTASSGLFIAFVAIKLHFVVAIFEALIALATLYFLYKTAFTEPGVIPRVAAGTFCPDGVDPFVNAPSVEVNGKQVKLTYCPTCHIYRPPRTKHCRRCDVCIEEFDHHCDFVSNCVGKRNYRYFLSFVMSVSFLVAYIFIADIVYLGITGHNGGFRELFTQPENLVGIALLFCAFMSFGVWGLCHYHMWLISRRTTTNEHIKGYFGGVRQNAEKPSLRRNLWRVLTQPTSESLIPLQKMVTPEGYLPNPPDFLMFSPCHPNAPRQVSISLDSQGGGDGAPTLLAESSNDSLANDETALLPPKRSTHASSASRASRSTSSKPRVNPADDEEVAGNSGHIQTTPQGVSRFVPISFVPDDYSLSKSSQGKDRGPRTITPPPGNSGLTKSRRCSDTGVNIKGNSDVAIDVLASISDRSANDPRSPKKSQ